MAAIRHAGVQVPLDMSLISLDEDEMLGYLEVPVTAVSMPLEVMGSAAFTALIEQFEGNNPPHSIEIDEPIGLVVRSSTGPVRRTPHYSRRKATS